MHRSAALLVLLLAPVPTWAQYSGFTNMSVTSMNAFIGTQRLSAQVRMSQRALDAVTRGASASAGAAQGGADTTAPTRAPTATTFEPSGKRLLVRSFAASLSEDPAERQTIIETLTRGLEAFEAEARRLGRPNSVAMALTYLVGVCVMVDSDEEAPEAALLTLQAKLDAAFGGSTTFTKLSDSDRQRLYEAMVLMATLPLAGYMVAKEEGDGALLQQYRALAAVALESSLGVRPERLRFTAEGLELRE